MINFDEYAEAGKKIAQARRAKQAKEMDQCQESWEKLVAVAREDFGDKIVCPKKIPSLCFADRWSFCLYPFDDNGHYTIIVSYDRTDGHWARSGPYHAESYGTRESFNSLEEALHWCYVAVGRI